MQIVLLSSNGHSVFVTLLCIGTISSGKSTLLQLISTGDVCFLWVFYKQVPHINDVIKSWPSLTRSTCISFFPDIACLLWKKAALDAGDTKAEVRVLHMIIFNCTRMMRTTSSQVGRFLVIYGSELQTRLFDETFTCYGLASTRL